jgi:DNA-binding transcriptional ArsR family regulator
MTSARPAVVASDGGDADLAAVGALLAEPARARILLALGDGRALPASVLASEAGVAPSTASSHLARLVDGGLLRVEPNGRHRYYRLAGPEVGRLIELLATLAPTRPVRSLRDGTRAAGLRRARTCYDHLAGRLGADLLAALVRDGLVTGGDGRHLPERAVADRLSAPGRDLDYRLTRAGCALLGELGVTLPAHGRDGTVPLRYCVDWTEQRHHLAGAVGRALTARLVELDWVRRAPRGRAVLVTETGQTQLHARFGLAAPIP